jgi:predicted dehydrogenase
LLHQPRAAIIGTGFIGRVHARALRQLGVAIVGVVASTPERSADAASELGVDSEFRDAGALIGHPDVDVVHVCTPNHLHRPLVDLALRAGKHVICEKPLGVSGAEAAGLAERARAAGVAAAVPFAYRYHPMATEARHRAVSGDLGRIHLVHGSYLQDWLLSPSAGGWRVDASLGGESRAFADIGSHWCDLAEWATGQRISELVATTETVWPQRSAGSEQTFAAGDADDRPLREVSTEDVACLLFRTNEGTVGSLTVSQVSPGRKNRLWIEIDGQEGSVVFDQERPESLWVGRPDISEDVVRDPAVLGADARRLSVLPPGHPQGFLDCFVAFLGDVYAAVRDGGEPKYPTFEDGLRVARLADAVLESARIRAWVKVEQ